MQALVVSAALKPNSRTLIAAKAVVDRLKLESAEVDLVDLAQYRLPLCDGASCYQDPDVRAMTKRVAQAHFIVICFPVYNYQPNAAAKNFVELTNDGWKDKVVAFVANAGGDRSYLAPLSLANSLMVDHRCLIVPQFLYLAPTAYNDAMQLDLQGLTAEIFEQQLAAGCRLAKTFV